MPKPFIPKKTSQPHPGPGVMGRIAFSGFVKERRHRENRVMGAEKNPKYFWTGGGRLTARKGAFGAAFLFVKIGNAMLPGGKKKRPKSRDFRS